MLLELVKTLTLHYQRLTAITLEVTAASWTFQQNQETRSCKAVSHAALTSIPAKPVVLVKAPSSTVKSFLVSRDVPHSLLYFFVVSLT